MPFYICIKKASDSGKPELRVVNINLYNSTDHGAIYAAVEDLPAPESAPEKAAVRLLRDGNLRTCPVRRVATAVTAQVVLYGGDKPQFIAGRKDFLDVVEILR